MKNGFDLTIDVRKLLLVPEITALLHPGGNIYQNERPSGRGTYVDIVINVLGVSNYHLQRGSGNINAYAPSLVSGGQTLADQAKLSKLASAVQKAVDAKYMATYETWLEDMPTIMQDTDGSWFVNIPFEYQSYNKEFKNI